MSADEAKRLSESLQTDLRLLSGEARKKFPQIKDAAETCCERIRNIASNDGKNFIAGLAGASTEILHPLLMGCDSKVPKLIQISLSGMQKLIGHSAIDENGARCIINELTSLSGSGIEELRLLQTVTVLLTANSLVRGVLLAKCLVICFRLHLNGKDPAICNAASATVRQLVTSIFERSASEQTGRKDSLSKHDHPGSDSKLAGPKAPPETLGPFSADCYCLFQDLCILLSNDHQTFWLHGLLRIPKDLGLDLLESILSEFLDLFRKAPEFRFLLKDQVCPLVIRLFSPNLKHTPLNQTMQSQASAADRPNFPVVMRLLRVVTTLITQYYSVLITECEIFLSLLLKFMDSERSSWQRALALEVLHRVTTQPDLILTFCKNYDMRPHATKVLQDIVHALGSFVQTSFIGGESSSASGASPSEDGAAGGPCASTPSFYYRGVWVPLTFLPTMHGQAKSFYLEMLDKATPMPVPDGYCLSVTFASLVDCVSSVNALICAQTTPPKTAGNSVEDNGATEPTGGDVRLQLVKSTMSGLLTAVSTLLEASLDENVTETLLKSVQQLVAVACKMDHNNSRDASLHALCKSCLPPNYMLTVMNCGKAGSAGSSAISSDSKRHRNLPTGAGENNAEVPEVHLAQIVAYGNPCPTPTLPSNLLNLPMGITTKNIQSMRALLIVAQIHGVSLNTSWHAVLATLQHFAWMLGLNPGLVPSSEAAAKQAREGLTTAVMADIPVLQAMITKLFLNTGNLDEVGLHHVLDALIKLSTDSMQVATQNRDISYFPILRLMEIGQINMHRIEVFWKPMTSHLLEVCSHQHSRLREEAAVALTTLIKTALQKMNESVGDSKLKSQRLILQPLAAFEDLAYEDVRKRQMDCVLMILRDYGNSLHVDIWPDLIKSIGSIVNGTHKFDSPSLIQSSFANIQLVITDFLAIISPPYLRQVIEACGLFGSQQTELNVSLTAVGLLWNMSDYLCRHCQRIQESINLLNKIAVGDNSSPGGGGKSAGSQSVVTFDSLWLCLFTCLSELCVDSRPPMRKSAGQTLFQTITSHGSLLRAETWTVVLWQVLFPLLDRVKALSYSASTARGDSASLGGTNILIHHSRDTESKQWAETRVLTLAGVAKVYCFKHSVLRRLNDFSKAWRLLLEYIEAAGRSDSSEIAISGLKSFLELLQASAGVKLSPLDAEGGPDRKNSAAVDPSVAEPLTVAHWMVAWSVWLNIAGNSTMARHSKAQGAFNPDRNMYPSPQFLTTLLNIFPLLFKEVKRDCDLADMGRLKSILEQISALPVAMGADSGSGVFIVPTTSPEVTPAQRAVLDAVVTVYEEASLPKSRLRPLLPTTFELLCTFISYSCKAPLSPLPSPSPQGGPGSGTKTSMHHSVGSADWIAANYVPFAESAMRTCTELYTASAHCEEVVKGCVVTEIVKTLHIPLARKFLCPVQSTWKLALPSLVAVLKVAFPVARQNAQEFMSLWPELAKVFEDFLFTKMERPKNLSFAELKECEQFDCQIVELARSEILPYAALLPDDFINRIIELLNRASIHPSDSWDVLDAPQELREELARLAFDTLLQFSHSPPDVVASGLPGLGSRAVTSLLHRCRTVLEQYGQEGRSQAGVPLPRHKILEYNSVLKALITLIKSLSSANSAHVDNELWTQIIAVYPALVECVRCSGPETDEALMDALKTYGMLLRVPGRR